MAISGGPVTVSLHRAMAVLNPDQFHPFNPDYGYTRKRPITHATSKGRVGAPYFRDLTDVPHSFTLNWTDRDVTTARGLKQFYEQYRGGAFILIDWDGGAREYVGRFSTPVEPVITRNASWSVQYVQFDELPGVPMRNYPSNWENDAVWYWPLDVRGIQTFAVQGAWTQSPNSNAEIDVDFVNAGNPGDWAQTQYVGYGFQFWARKGPDLGGAMILLDGVQVGSIDFYAPAATAASSLFAEVKVPYGMHRVKLIAAGTKNAASSGTSVVWDSVRVMR